ncbi:MAG: hypothetical protein KDH09_02140 [Chrysiogenetes bacterium]|nr:hypothetical protein [Chrysiogenetes bacterium]
MSLLGNRHAFIARSLALIALCAVTTGCESNAMDQSETAPKNESVAKPPPAPKNESSKVFRYEDSNGNLHFVTGRHNIPPQYLAQARTIDGSKLETYDDAPAAPMPATEAEPAKEEPAELAAEPEGLLARIGSGASALWMRIRNWFSPPPPEPPAGPKYEGPPNLAIYDLSGKAWFAWCEEISAALEEQTSAQAAERRVIGKRTYSGSTSSRRVTGYNAADGRYTTKMKRYGSKYKANGETLEVYNAGKAADDAIMEAAHLRKDALAAGDAPEWVLDGNCDGQASPIPPTWPERHPLYYQRQATVGR